jgi:hypothetical protein
MVFASVSISKIASLSMLQQCRLLPRPSLPHDFICVALTLLRQRPRLPEIPCSFERLWSYTGRTALTTVTRILVRSITFSLRFSFGLFFCSPEIRIPTFESDPSFCLRLELPTSNDPGRIKTAQPERNRLGSCLRKGEMLFRTYGTPNLNCVSRSRLLYQGSQ